jgi:hypothetical protein
MKGSAAAAAGSPRPSYAATTRVPGRRHEYHEYHEYARAARYANGVRRGAVSGNHTIRALALPQGARPTRNGSRPPALTARSRHRRGSPRAVTLDHAPPGALPARGVAGAAKL